MENSVKNAAKEAKKRLKNGYWGRLAALKRQDVENAEREGRNRTAVIEYYRDRAKIETRKTESDEAFYQKVKKLLDEEGEVSNAIGRLTDQEAFESLDYGQKQRYTLELSARYLKAVERYQKEKSLTAVR